MTYIIIFGFIIIIMGIIIYMLMPSNESSWKVSNAIKKIRDLCCGAREDY
jgi:cytochrome b subunit of formate dehydrogenase